MCYNLCVSVETWIYILTTYRNWVLLSGQLNYCAPTVSIKHGSPQRCWESEKPSAIRGLQKERESYVMLQKFCKLPGVAIFSTQPRQKSPSPSISLLNRWKIKTRSRFLLRLTSPPLSPSHTTPQGWKNDRARVEIKISLENVHRTFWTIGGKLGVAVMGRW